MNRIFGDFLAEFVLPATRSKAAIPTFARERESRETSPLGEFLDNDFNDSKDGATQHPS
jgi:hypothetical protein